MKVELKNLRLGISAITERAQVGIIGKDNITWRYKKDIHNDFLHAIVTCWKNKKQVISSPGGKFEITVKEISPKPPKL